MTKPISNLPEHFPENGVEEELDALQYHKIDTTENDAPAQDLSSVGNDLISQFFKDSPAVPADFRAGFVVTRIMVSSLKGGVT